MMLLSSVIVQVFQVPLMVGFLGPQQYGVYVVSYAMTSILTVADFGTFGASSTRLIGLVNQRKMQEATILVNSMFSAFSLLAMAGSLVAVSLIASLLMTSPSDEAEVVQMTQLALILTCHSTLLLFSSLWESFQRGIGRYAQVWRQVSLFRVLDFATLAVSIAISRDLLLSLCAMLVARFCTTGYVVDRILRRKDWTGITVSLGAVGYLAKDVKTNAASLTQVLSNWIVSQGLVLVINSSIGVNSAAIYSALRTFLGGIKQVTQVLINAEAPLITSGHTNIPRLENYRSFRKLHLQVVVGALALACFMSLFGSKIFEFWSGGKLYLPEWVVPMFSLVTLFEILYLTGAVWVVTQNKHLKTMAAYAISMAFVACCVFVFKPSLLILGAIMAVTLLFLILLSEMDIRTDANL
jgi:O-antigen/teichoic acid export membrane protein